jgi:sulfoxide reductase heme-binding subunit YedZ
MNLSKLPFKGWGIVIWITFALSILSGLILILYGVNEVGFRLLIRATARTSCLLFLAAFVASSLRKLWPQPFPSWLLKSRRYFGLALAVSHGFHALAIMGLIGVTSFENVGYDFGGSLGYLFIIAMTITSFHTTARWLGKRGWKILHTVGMYYLWLAFTYSFINKLSQSLPVYLPFVCLLLLALLIRLITPRMNRQLTHQSELMRE